MFELRLFVKAKKWPARKLKQTNNKGNTVTKCCGCSTNSTSKQVPIREKKFKYALVRILSCHPFIKLLVTPTTNSKII